MTLPEFKCWLDAFMWEIEYPNMEQWALIKQRLNEIKPEKQCACKASFINELQDYYDAMHIKTDVNFRLGIPDWGNNPLAHNYQRKDPFESSQPCESGIAKGEA